MKKDLKIEAIEALKALVHQVSAIDLKGIEFKSPVSGHAKHIMASIDVYGHRHVLVCRVKANAQPRYIRLALRQLTQLGGDMTPILIAPHLPAEAQALCRTSKIGFLDMDGNALLVLDEVFFAKRSLSVRHPIPAVVSTVLATERLGEAA